MRSFTTLLSLIFVLCLTPGLGRSLQSDWHSDLVSKLGIDEDTIKEAQDHAHDELDDLENKYGSDVGDLIDDLSGQVEDFDQTQATTDGEDYIRDILQLVADQMISTDSVDGALADGLEIVIDALADALSAYVIDVDAVVASADVDELADAISAISVDELVDVDELADAISASVDVDELADTISVDELSDHLGDSMSVSVYNVDVTVVFTDFVACLEADDWSCAATSLLDMVSSVASQLESLQADADEWLANVSVEPSLTVDQIDVMRAPMVDFLACSQGSFSDVDPAQMTSLMMDSVVSDLVVCMDTLAAHPDMHPQVAQAFADASSVMTFDSSFVDTAADAVSAWYVGGEDMLTHLSTASDCLSGQLDDVSSCLSSSIHDMVDSASAKADELKDAAVDMLESFITEDEMTQFAEDIESWTAEQLPSLSDLASTTDSLLSMESDIVKVGVEGIIELIDYLLEVTPESEVEMRLMLVLSKAAFEQLLLIDDLTLDKSYTFIVSFEPLTEHMLSMQENIIAGDWSAVGVSLLAVMEDTSVMLAIEEDQVVDMMTALFGEDGTMPEMPDALVEIIAGMSPELANALESTEGDSLEDVLNAMADAMDSEGESDMAKEFRDMFGLGDSDADLEDTSTIKDMIDTGLQETCGCSGFACLSAMWNGCDSDDASSDQSSADDSDSTESSDDINSISSDDGVADKKAGEDDAEKKAADGDESSSGPAWNMIFLQIMAGLVGVVVISVVAMRYRKRRRANRQVTNAKDIVVNPKNVDFQVPSTAANDYAGVSIGVQEIQLRVAPLNQAEQSA